RPRISAPVSARRRPLLSQRKFEETHVHHTEIHHARRKHGLTRAKAVCASVAGTGLVGASTIVGVVMTGPAASAATLSQAWYASAPYVMPLDNSPPDIASVMAGSGEKAFMLAFILANGSSCSPAWDGTAPVSSDTAVANYI